MVRKLILPGDPGFAVADEVNKFHSYDDLNKSPQAHHHSLGHGANEAAAGNHSHIDTAWRRNTASSGFVAGTWTRIDLDTEIEAPTSNFVEYDAVLNQYVIKRAGLYLFNGHWDLNSDAVTVMYGRFRKNGVTKWGRVNEGTGQVVGMEATKTIWEYMAVGDYMAIDGYVSGGAGGSRVVITGDEWLASSLQVMRLGS